MEKKITPEYLALSQQLACTVKMQEMAVSILHQDKMTQGFVKGALEVLIDGYFNLEEKTVTALNRCHGYSAEIAHLRVETAALREALGDAVILLEASAKGPSSPDGTCSAKVVF